MFGNRSLSPCRNSCRANSDNSNAFRSRCCSGMRRSSRKYSRRLGRSFGSADIVLRSIACLRTLFYWQVISEWLPASLASSRAELDNTSAMSLAHQPAVVNGSRTFVQSPNQLARWLLSLPQPFGVKQKRGLVGRCVSSQKRRPTIARAGRWWAGARVSGVRRGHDTQRFSIVHAFRASAGCPPTISSPRPTSVPLPALRTQPEPAAQVVTKQLVVIRIDVAVAVQVGLRSSAKQFVEERLVEPVAGRRPHTGTRGE
jgi:hypothetical protein